MTARSSDSFKIGIAGLGTVGVGVVKILQQNADTVAQRAGKKIDIVSVIASSKDKDRGVDLSSYEWADDLKQMAQDNRLDCVVELIGGSDGAVLDMVETAIVNGKDIVTANKALLAHHGYRLAEIAEGESVTIAYEAAVAGGIPIIKSLREGLAANRMQAVSGILNGTCNYILSDMRTSGRDFNTVLKEAQEKGYAEADPTFDVDGIDTAHKLTLLAALAFGVKPDFDALQIQGIRDITAHDIDLADMLGCRIKLLGSAKEQAGKVLQTVEPCLVPTEGMLGSTSGVYNAVLTQGDPVGQSVAIGLGAGEGPTASSVVADIIDIAKGYRQSVFGIPVQCLREMTWENGDAFEAPYYVRLMLSEQNASDAVVESIKDAFTQGGICIDKTIMSADKAVVAFLTKQMTGADVKNKADIIMKQVGGVKPPLILRVER